MASEDSVSETDNSESTADKVLTYVVLAEKLIGLGLTIYLADKMTGEHLSDYVKQLLYPIREQWKSYRQARAFQATPPWFVIWEAEQIVKDAS